VIAMRRRSRAAGMLKPPHHISMVSRSGIAMSNPPATPRPYEVAVARTDEARVNSLSVPIQTLFRDPIQSTPQWPLAHSEQKGQPRIVYSTLIATIGSTRSARRVGTTQASRQTPSMKTAYAARSATWLAVSPLITRSNWYV
jgi:hypothetical protein